ncbi:DUF6519 domain-containing protein [Crossiella sp. SN42]|uniref:DUF6519 domain-containing protein n=1 Tax=Crossiella sp. SN42 TaxID=2944808 RepID=UPI00207D37EC|nr:DUF6519 domain-containing protein [Crossiella sp. SN42]MCO1577847.1 DUF6519 domain-containing protein [Crossiella sp. SN42]
MHGDFSRLTFRPDKRFSAVLAQQGRVQLDAEANEQVLISQHRHRTAISDLIGRRGGPRDANGFRIAFVPKGKEPADLKIHGGRYYVDGILVEATRPPRGVPVPDEPETDPAPPPAAEWTYWDQPDAHRDRERQDEAHHLPDLPFLAYLLVTEHLVTAIQDPEIRETALGPALPDTTARTKVSWQVLPLTAKDGLQIPDRPTPESLTAAFDSWVDRGRATARLAARAERPARTEDDPCLSAPDARFRGLENQLYRVEIHLGGKQPTFKWSRENGSVTLPVSTVDKTWVTLAEGARDRKLGLSIGDWVELADDASVARGEAGPLAQVRDLDTEALRVELSREPGTGVGRPGRHAFLRRWDQRGDAIRIEEGRWLDLEDGVQVWFATGGRYRGGDYWLIPARTLSGEVEWPRDERGAPLLQDPHGIRRHYAPLAWIPAGNQLTDLRLTFPPLAQHAS